METNHLNLILATRKPNLSTSRVRFPTAREVEAERSERSVAQHLRMHPDVIRSFTAFFSPMAFSVCAVQWAEGVRRGCPVVLEAG